MLYFFLTKNVLFGRSMTCNIFSIIFSGFTRLYASYDPMTTDKFCGFVCLLLSVQTLLIMAFIDFRPWLRSTQIYALSLTAQNPIKTAGLSWRRNGRRGKKTKRTNSSWSRDTNSARIVSIVFVTAPKYGRDQSVLNRKSIGTSSKATKFFEVLVGISH